MRPFPVFFSAGRGGVTHFPAGPAYRSARRKARASTPWAWRADR